MSSGRVRAAVAIHGTLGALAWWATSAVGRSPWHLDRGALGPRWLALPMAATLGAGVGIAAVAASRWLVRRAGWARALHQELRLATVGLSHRAVAPLALSAAIGEEVFFRGGIQAAMVAAWGPLPGLLAASAVFGLAHVPWNRRLLWWTASATVMGVVLGALYQLTGELLAPIVAHVVVHHENLRFILANELPDGPLAGRARAAAD